MVLIDTFASSQTKKNKKVKWCYIFEIVNTLKYCKFQIRMFTIVRELSKLFIRKLEIFH